MLAAVGADGITFSGNISAIGTLITVTLKGLEMRFPVSEFLYLFTCFIHKLIHGTPFRAEIIPSDQ